MHEEVIQELKDYLLTVEQFDKDNGQSGDLLHEYLIQLTNYMARANYLMAEHEKMFRDAKKKAYHTLMVSSYANNKYYAPSLAKDYIDSCCSEEGYVYSLAERVSRTALHTTRAIITIISSLKQEKIFAKIGT